MAQIKVDWSKHKQIVNMSYTVLMYKSDLSDKVKQDFVQTVVVSGATMRLHQLDSNEMLGENLDEKNIRMMRSVLN